MSTSYIASTRIASLKQINSTIVVGIIACFARPTAPAGWLICDGTLYERSEYIDLFSVIGTTYGNTTSTNFRVPDLRGTFVRGIDLGKGLDLGRVFASHQEDASVKHKHTGSISVTSDGTHTHTITGEPGYDGKHSHKGVKYGYYTTRIGCSHAHDVPRSHANRTPANTSSTVGGKHKHDKGNENTGYSASNAGLHTHAGSTIVIANAGSNIDVETRPKNVALLYCIRF